MSSISNQKLFWSALLAFTALNILIVYAVGPIFHVSETMGGNQHDGYLELAANVARGNGFVFEPKGAAVIHRPPAYVIALIPGTCFPAMIQRLYVILLNSALAAGTAVLIRKMALRISHNRKIAALSVALLVSNPWIIWSIKNPMAVILQMFLYLLMAYLSLLFIQLKPYGDRWRLIAFSAVFGWVCAIGSLSHGIMLPISLILMGMIAFRVVQQCESFKLPALLLSLMVLFCTVLPWTIRNFHVTGRIIPVVGNSGTVYFGGNAYWGISKPPVQEGETIFQATLRHAGVSLPPESVFHFWGLKDPSVDQQLKNEMVQHIKTHPRSFVKKIFFNGLGYYFPIAHQLIIPPPAKADDNGEESRSFSPKLAEVWIISVYHATILVLSMCAIIFSKKNFLGLGGVALSLIFIVLYAFPYFPFLTFVGHSHYVFGTLPFLYLLTAELLYRLYLKSTWRTDDKTIRPQE